MNEAISSLVNKRGKYLFDGVKNLLNDPGFTGLAQQVYNHGLVASLTRERAGTRANRHLPAYLSATTFSLALVDILSARGVVDAVHGELLSAAERADDRFESALATRDASPAGIANVAQATAARNEAEAALTTAATLARAAVTAASAANDTELAKRLDVQALTAEAAIKILTARRAAVACAKRPRDAALIQAAANSLERALATGRAIAEMCPDPLTNLQRAFDRLPEGHTKESLLVLIAKTRREVTSIDRQVIHFQRNVEDWFNGAMSHVSGWYKRWTQVIIAVIATLAVCAANVDTVQIIQRLSRDTALRAALVAAADNATRNPPGSSEGVNAVLDQAASLSLPIGWTKAAAKAATTPFGLLSKLLGLIGSILAVSLGAPFWFDTLSKIVNLRGASSPPDDSKRTTAA